MSTRNGVRIARMAFALALGLSAGASAPTQAQSGGQFDLIRVTIDSGGGTSSAPGLALTGTIGQPDVGAATGPGFSLQGGFWASTAPTTTDVLFNNGFESP